MMYGLLMFFVVWSACTAAVKIISRRFFLRSHALEKTMQDVRATTLQADALMTTTWNSLQQLITAGQVTEQLAVQCFGKLQVRVILHILKKEKHGREPKGYKDLAEIFKLYEQELAGKTALEATSAKSSEGAKTLQEQTPSAIALMKNKQLKLGELYTNPLHVQVDPGKIYQFTKITDSFATFMHTPLFGQAEVLDMLLTELKQWRHHTGKAPVLVPTALALSCSPENSTSILQDVITSRAFLMLHEFYSGNVPSVDSFYFSCNPASVHAAKKFATSPAPKTLKLYPLGNLHLIPAVQADKHSCVLKFKDTSKSSDVFHLALTPPKSALNLSKLDENSKTILIPYFWVTGTSEEEAANLERHLFDVKDGDQVLTVPLFRNTKPIPPQTALHFFKAKPEPKKRARLA